MKFTRNDISIGDEFFNGKARWKITGIKDEWVSLLGLHLSKERRIKTTKRSINDFLYNMNKLDSRFYKNNYEIY